MAHYSSFEDLEVYKNARIFCVEIWQIMNATSLSTDYKLRDQINGSSGSIMDNIAEGFGRGGNREFINFLSYSRGSCSETKAQLHRCLDRGHISQERFEVLEKAAQNIIEQIGKFINYLKYSNKKGNKFNQ